MTLESFYKQLLQFLKIEIVLQIIIFIISLLFFNWQFSTIWSGGGSNSMIFPIISTLFFIIACSFSINRLIYFLVYLKLENKVQRMFQIEILVFIISLLALLEWSLNSFADFFKKITSSLDWYYNLDYGNRPSVLGFFLVLYIGYNLDLYSKVNQKVRLDNSKS